MGPKAYWINFDGDSVSWQAPERPAPQLRKSFHLTALPRQAVVTFAAPGWAEITINGKKITEDIMTPAVTQLDKRTGVCSYDVTEFLRPGENVIGALLGNGWFNCATHEVWHFDKALWRNKPRLFLTLNADDRTIVVSDTTWRGKPGGIFFNQLRSGERFDANNITPGWDLPGFDDTSWKQAQVVFPPPGELTPPDSAPQCRIREVIQPQKVTELAENIRIYDFGKNLTGFCRITVSGEKGAKCELLYSELLNPETGDVDRKDISSFIIAGDIAQYDLYIHGETDPFVWQPRFVYHGFRYVKIITTGEIDSIKVEACYVHSNFARNGKSTIADPTAAKLFSCTDNSFTANFTGIPTDCPHREKNGWTGDAHLACETGLWLYDAAENYRHYVQIIADTQRPSGQICSIAPTPGWGYNWGSGPVWDAALFEIPYQIWQFTGDKSCLLQNLDTMKKYISYALTLLQDGIIYHGLGDWCHYDRSRIVNTGVTSTAYLCRMLQIIQAVSEADAAEYQNLRMELIGNFIRRFRNADGTYANDEMTANACAVYFGIDDSPALIDHLAAQLRANSHKADFGIIGAKTIPRVLAANGYAADAFKCFIQPEFPGWGNWIARGATSLWENWDGTGSQTHVMYGDFPAWCFNFLAGIRIMEPGFKSVMIAPADVPEAGNYTFSFRTPYGEITTERTGSTFRCHVPEAIKCTLAIPETMSAEKI